MRKYLTHGFLAAATIACRPVQRLAQSTSPVPARRSRTRSTRNGPRPTSRRPAIGMNYQSIGSGGGIAQIKAKTVDFGASDMPLKPEDLQAAGLMQFPAIIGGVVPVVNIEGVAPGAMKFTGPVLADIYLGKIKKWNEKPIADLNPGDQAARRAHHGRAAIGRLGDDFRLDRLPVEDEPRMEGQGRREHRGVVARRRGRQGQRGRRRVRSANQGFDRLRRVRVREAKQDGARARSRTRRASSCSRTTIRFRPPRRSPTGRMRQASIRS